MKFPTTYLVQILAVIATAEVVALPNAIRTPADKAQEPLVDQPAAAAMPSDSQQQQAPLKTLTQSGVLISDVMGRDRSINIFAGLTRDVASISSRLDSSGTNSTVLAPLNSAVERLPRRPWEDARDYEALGAGAYDDKDGNGDGMERARRNLRRFVEAHTIPASPWAEGERVRSLLEGDREVWWETRDDGVRVIRPDNIEVQNVASRVGNGEVWILKAVRNYS
ncbi:hypothetical protein GGR56DRAFT_559792 [Xylariaceae sp. FL0804]|nr:hypothetical protein GGR56DRAFT_559792 [Xylariaceae sp. FL0804]